MGGDEQIAYRGVRERRTELGSLFGKIYDIGGWRCGAAAAGARVVGFGLNVECVCSVCDEAENTV